jgi:hypothetical protein
MAPPLQDHVEARAGDAERPRELRLRQFHPVEESLFQDLPRRWRSGSSFEMEHVSHLVLHVGWP